MLAGKQEKHCASLARLETEEGPIELEDKDVYNFEIDFPASEAPKRVSSTTVTLMDLAKPTKKKGPLHQIIGGILPVR